MLRVKIEGRLYERAAIHDWEDRRTVAVRRRLDLPPSTAPRARQRRELLERKLTLGHRGLREVLGRGCGGPRKSPASP